MAEGSAKPIEDVRDISAITYGFMASKALFTALDIDLFTHIDRGAGNLVGLAKATGVSENLLLTLLTALKSLGLIVEHNTRFVNAPATAKFLVAGAPGDFRDYVRLVNGAPPERRAWAPDSSQAGRETQNQVHLKLKSRRSESLGRGAAVASLLLDP
jgi:hypothetical protein